MKYSQEAFFKFPKKVVFSSRPEEVPEKYRNLSSKAIHLLVVLLALENAHTTRDKDYFSQSNEMLCSRMGGTDIRTLSKAKKELIEAGLIECWKETIPDKESKRKTTCAYCHYRILI